MNNQFSNPYMPYYSQPPQDNLAYLRNQQQPINSIIYVQGEEAAKSYLVARNNTVVLWDTENPCIYKKYVDNNGIPFMQIFDIKERTATVPGQPTNNYVTKEELNDILKGYLAKPTPKVEVKADE